MSLVGCSPRGRWVGDDWANSLLLFIFMHWRREWQPTPVFLPGESQGQGSLVGCRLWGRAEWDKTEVTQQQWYNKCDIMKLSTEELMFWTVVFEKTLKSPLKCKEIKPVNPKGNQSWMFIGRTDAEAPILWPPDAKYWLIGKDHDAGKDWRQEEKGTTEDEMVGWHHQLDGHEFEEAPGIGDGQRSLACCSPWSHKESHTTEPLNWAKWAYIELYTSNLKI